MSLHLRSQPISLVSKAAHSHRTSSPQRRGVVLPLVAISMVMFLIFTALAIDVGYMYVVKSELQRSADNGALGGAMRFSDLTALKKNKQIYTKLDAVKNRAKEYVERNSAGGKQITVDTSTIVLGYLSDPYDSTLPIDTGADPLTFNVIQVTTRRTADSQNGALPLFFAKIMGKATTDLTATAVAVLDDNFAGIKVPETKPSPIIPFVIKETEWIDQIINGNGPDEYSADENDNVLFFPDGVPEIQLYPEKLKEDGSTAAGNFGLINVGVDDNSTGAVSEQILGGITGQQLIGEFGTNELMVYENGNSQWNVPVSGNPGLSASLESALLDRLGEVVGFFLYSEILGGNGNNTVFNIVGIQFGRIVAIELNGSDKEVILQPEAYYGSDIITSPDAPSTSGVIGKLSLVR